MVATVIKFVCMSCTERLSVPDRFAGRKGACPACGAINRVPLKGFPEDQPAAPVRASVQTPRTAVTRTLGDAAHIQTNGHANGHANGYTNGHANGHTNGAVNGHALNGAVGSIVAETTPRARESIVDRRGRIEPAVPPIPIPAPKPRVVPPAEPVIPAPAAKLVAPAPAAKIAPVVTVPPVAPAPAAPVARIEAPAAPPVGLSAPKQQTLIAGFDLPAVVTEHEPIGRVSEEFSLPSKPRQALAADELTPGERWKRAFAESDVKPSRLQKLFAKFARAKTEPDAYGRRKATDEDLPAALKVGLLVGGVLALVGVVYLTLHLLLWAGTGT